ncbi:MAG: hypothetical protein OXB86_05395 [Bdellovibrionales bacterium]|nr:hypothetical protein [Bdellovibrionales bacterium]
MFSFALLLFYLYTKHFLGWDIFTSRDLMRAQDWLNGRFHWPGPEMSGGNNLPGPFFYFLLFPAFIFGEEALYHQSRLWHIVWLALTYTVAFSFIDKITKYKESRVLFLMFFISNIGIPLFGPLTFAWNVSFSILFHIFAFIGLYYWRQTNKNSYLYFVGLIIALGIQVHLLVAVHIITVLYFTFLSGKKNARQSFVLFLFLACFPVLLYGLLSPFDVLKTSNLRLNHLFHVTDLFFSKEWFKYINLYFSPFYGMIPLFLFFFIFRKKWSLNKIFNNSINDNSFIIITIIPCFIGILIAGKGWYLHFVPIFLISAFSKLFDDLMPNSSNKRLSCLIILSLVLIFPLLFSYKEMDLLSSGNLFNRMKIHHIVLFFLMTLFFFMMNVQWTRKNFKKISIFLFCLLLTAQIKISENLIPWKTLHIKKFFSLKWAGYQHLNPLLKKVSLETNWPAKEAMKRLYVIGIHDEISLFSHYSMTEEFLKTEIAQSFNKKQLNLTKSSEAPQGYMIIAHLKQFSHYSKKDWTLYLSRSSLLSNFLKQEIIDGKILIKNPVLYDLFWLIPYKSNSSVFVRGFSNLGQPYYWEVPEWLKGCSFTGKFQNQNDFYYCMVLKGHLQKAGVRISLFEVQTNNISRQLNLSINFVGPLIGSRGCCDNLNGSAIWSDIQIKLLCNEDQLKYNLPINIGNHWRIIRRKKPAQQGQIFVAPLNLQIPVKEFINSTKKSSGDFISECKKQNIKQIELTFSHVYGERRGGIQFPAEKVKTVWKWNE